ncbi:Uncharacterised protein [Nocardia africana]|uniref:Uncharacterized protein n=1 Tax=Nocardia africana TaxID=134964 RepID=A0A378WY38_9NOCA|nr:Uncharacterised protein [Nocardia africana]
MRRMSHSLNPEDHGYDCARRQWLRTGPGSLTVLVVYVLGVVGLALIPA